MKSLIIIFLTTIIITSLCSACYSQSDSLTKVKVKRLEQDVYFVIDQLQLQNRSCEIAKQSILTASTIQLTGNVKGIEVIQGQLSGVQTELSSTKVLLGSAQYANLQLQKDLKKAKTMSKLERVSYFLGGVVITYFTIKITK